MTKYSTKQAFLDLSINEADLSEENKFRLINERKYLLNVKE